MKVYKVKKELENYIDRIEKTNLINASLCIKDDKLIINTEIDGKYSTPLEVLNLINNELNKEDLDKDKFLSLDVYIYDLGELFELKSLWNFISDYPLDFEYKECRGILHFKEKKDEKSVKNAYKKILNNFDMDLDSKDIVEVVNKTKVNGIDGFKELLENYYKYLDEKLIKELIKERGIDISDLDEDMADFRDYSRYPYTYIDVIEEEDYYFIAFSVFPDESYQG